MSTSYNVVFAGTPMFALKILQPLYASQHNVMAVYSQPDRPAGRGRKLTASPVKEFALQHNLPVFQPENLKTSETIAPLIELAPDILIVVAYGLLLPKRLLTIPKFGCINVHASLLPRWRGAAPIQRAILAGDKVTGITTMQMTAGLDSGPILLQSSCKICDNDTSPDLENKLAQLAWPCLETTLEKLMKIEPKSQDETKVTYAHKLTKTEGLIDWWQPAEQLQRKIRALQPWPTSYTQLNGLTVKINKAEILTADDDASAIKPGTILSISKEGLCVMTGKDLLRINQCTLPGKRTLNISDIINAPHPFTTGEVFS